MTLRLFNSLSRSLETFVPIDPSHVRMYVCGMTVYDHCHVGHARSMTTFDVVARWLRVLGYKLTYVRNVTDIDDKIIKRALERNIPIRQLTDEMTAAMHEDADALGILPPDFEPRATDHVSGMLSIIQTLQDKGLAYQSSSGDVNYAVRKFPTYGKLSGKTLDQLRAGERVAVQDGKEDPFDFVLWKSAKADEPEDAKWPSPYGPGRPGWHIECSAMSCALLGEHFDIHGGGLDLQFPHHENEIAQSEGASGKPYVNYWMHNGFLNVDNQKMSKSLGNFFTIRDVLERYDGETIRFLMLRTHYRSPFNFSDAHLDDARSALKRLYTALDTLELPDEQDIDWSNAAAAKFRDAMNEDFNTPAALAVMFDLAGEVNRSRSIQAALLLKQLGSTLGLLQQAPRDYLQDGGRDADAGLAHIVQDAIERRAAAKAARDFSLADQIRKELLSQGVVLQDSPQGTTWTKV